MPQQEREIELKSKRLATLKQVWPEGSDMQHKALDAEADSRMNEILDVIQRKGPASVPDEIFFTIMLLYVQNNVQQVFNQAINS